VTTNRGGDVTLHAPGQLVAYPIVDLSPDRRDVRRWVKNLTETMRRVTLELGIVSGTHEKHVGLWADAAAPHQFTTAEEALTPVKIGAIGVRISHWITMHGFALNLDPELELYRAIVPCGIREHGVSSIRALGGAAIAVEHAAERAFAALADVTASVASPLVDARDAALVDIEAELLNHAA
jgi:lipoyl(octanoyl) transferase